RYEALGELAEFEAQLHADVEIRQIQGDNGKLTIELQASIGSEREPLVFVRRGARIHWVPPQALQRELPGQILDLTDELDNARVQVVLRSRRDESEYVVSTASATVLVRAPGEWGKGRGKGRGEGRWKGRGKGSGEAGAEGRDAKRPVLVAGASIDHAKAAAGSRLPAGEW